jgi:hypothetical protein
MPYYVPRPIPGTVIKGTSSSLNFNLKYIIRYMKTQKSGTTLIWLARRGVVCSITHGTTAFALRAKMDRGESSRRNGKLLDIIIGRLHRSHTFLEQATIPVVTSLSTPTTRSAAHSSSLSVTRNIVAPPSQRPCARAPIHP